MSSCARPFYLFLVLPAAWAAAWAAALAISSSPPDQKSTPERPRAERDGFGDPLPEGALARLGTVRFRKSPFLTQVELTPDGKLVAATGQSVQGLILWDRATGREELHIRNQRESSRFAFSPDGQLVALFSRPTGAAAEELVLYDAHTGNVVRRLVQVTQGLLAFSPDGKILASCGNYKDHRGIQLWEVATGKLLREIPASDTYLASLSFSPDGKLLACCDPYGKVKTAVQLWEAATGKALPSLAGHKTPVYTAAFSPDGKHIVSGCEDGAIRTWEWASGKQVQSRNTDHGMVYCLCYSPDGRSLASGHEDGTVGLWSAATLAPTRAWRAHKLLVSSLQFSSDGKTLLSACHIESAPRLWDVASGAEIHAHPGHRGHVNWLVFTDGGKKLLSLGAENTVLSWDLHTGENRIFFDLPASGPQFCAISPDRKLLAMMGYKEGSFELWEMGSKANASLLATYRTAADKPRNLWMDVCFSADGRLLAGLFKDRIHLWDVKSQREIRQIDVVGAEFHLAFSADGTVLACSARASRYDEDATLHFWDVDTGKELRRLDVEQFPGELKFSPDGRWLAAAGDWRRTPAHLWDMTTGKRLALKRMESDAYSLAFSSDSKYLATGGSEKEPITRIWDLPSRKELVRFDGHDPAVSAIAFSQDGRLLATGSSSSQILVWDLARKLPHHSAEASARAPVQSTRALLGAWILKPPFRYPEARHGKGELRYINDIPVLTVRGTPEEIGEQIGVLGLRPVVADQDESIDQLLVSVLRSHNINKALPLLIAMCNGLFHRFPEEYRRELEAMARSSGLPRDLLVIVNLGADLYDMGCSTLIVEPGRSATGKPLFGRNLDTAPVMGVYKYGLVVVYRPEGKRPFASIGYPGTLGPFTAINDAGLALAMDGMYATADGSPAFSPLGMPVFAELRRLMGECTTVQEAEQHLRSHPIAHMLGLTVCDKAGGVVFELTTKNVVRRGPVDDICACTNHFLTKGLTTGVQCWRYPILDASRKLPRLSLDDVAKKMDAVNQGSWTVQTMVLEPADLKVHLATGKGPSSRLPLRELDLAGLLK